MAVHSIKGTLIVLIDWLSIFLNLRTETQSTSYLLYTPTSAEYMYFRIN